MKSNTCILIYTLVLLNNLRNQILIEMGMLLYLRKCVGVLAWSVVDHGFEL